MFELLGADAVGRGKEYEQDGNELEGALSDH
jgi:hypothetical protein